MNNHFLKLLTILGILLFVLLIVSVGICENASVKVTATLLNGRANPTKKSTIEARFDKNDILQTTGEWSDNYHWIEVVGGETGTVWVFIDYITEDEPFSAINKDYKRVKIRSSPVDGRVVGYLNKDCEVEIEQTVFGWGKCKKGWIDLYFLEETE